MERIECQESRQKMEQGAVDAPPRKRKNLQRLQKQIRSPNHNINLSLNRNKAERASFETSWGDKTVKQAILTVVRQTKDETPTGKYVVP